MLSSWLNSDGQNPAENADIRHVYSLTLARWRVHGSQRMHMLCDQQPHLIEGPTCAVVGSADYASNRGYVIDSHQLVWRVNDAPTVGFGQLVGNRTTHRFINRVSVSVWANRQHIEHSELHDAYTTHAFDPSVCFNVTCTLIDGDEKTVSDLAEARRLHPALKVKIDTTARKDARICKSSGGAKTLTRSAGFVAAVRALRTCRMPVSLFGFDPECCTNSSRVYKYYHNPKSKWVCCAAGREDMRLETAVLNALAADGKVDFLDNATAMPPQISLDVPTFRRRVRKLPLPGNSLFLSCTNASRTLCVVRKNASARQVLVIANRQVVATIDEADDPRVFTHAGSHWILNNNYYHMTLIELFSNATIGREIRVPIMQAKNLVPISWNDRHFYLLDLQDQVIWPAQLEDETTVLVKRPIQLHMRRTYIRGGCNMPPLCKTRGGTQGVHLTPTDDHVYGVGHCTGSSRFDGHYKLQHTPYWWILNLPRRELTFSGLCFSSRRLVDPSALYPVMQSGFSKQHNTTWIHRVWLLDTAEADEQWNRKDDQLYYNKFYRAALQHTLVSPPSPPLSKLRPPAYKSNLSRRFARWVRHFKP